jgi:hypothetical protein
MASTMSRYKGFRILAVPYELQDSHRWMADVEIRREGRSQPIRFDDRYNSAQEAVAHGASVARRIIDGGMPRWSVHGLGGNPWSFSHCWKVLNMRPYMIGGVLLLVVGLFVLVRGGSFTSQESLLEVGDLKVTASERQTIPPWVGVVALVAGAVLVAGDLKKRS